MKNWLHFILNKEGRSYYEDEDGVVKLTSIPTATKHTADGWKDVSIGYERDWKKFGLIKKFTFPLNFVLDAAKIIRSVVYKTGIEAELFYLITKRRVVVENDQFKDYYSKWYRGEFDLSKIKDEENKISCTIGPYGLEKLLAVHEDTEYEFPLSDSDAVNLKMDGVIFYSSTIMQAPPEVEYDNSLYTNRHIVPFGIVSQEGDPYGLALFDQYLQNAPVVFDNDATNYFAAVDVSSPNSIFVTLDGKLVVKVTQKLINASVRFVLRSNMGLERDIAGSAGTLNDEVTIPIHTTIEVRPGEHIFLYAVVFGLFSTGSVGFKYVFMPASEVTITYNNKYKETTIRCFEPAVLLDKIVEKICGQKSRTLSNLLSSGDFSGLLITSGDGVRSADNAVVKISLSGFHDIYTPYCFAGSSIESDTLRFETIDRFFPANDTPIDLGDAASLEIEYDTNLLASTIEVGHASKDLDGVNGKYKFNDKHIYTTPSTRSKNKFSIVSPAITDPYVIENIRANFGGKKTTDDSKDNDLIVINATKSTETNSDAVASSPRTLIYASGSNISYKNFNFVGLYPNAEFSEFYWLSSSTTAGLIKVYVLPVLIPASPASVTVDVMINGVSIASASVSGNGSTPLNIQVSHSFVQADVLSIRVTAPTILSILACSLTVALPGQSNYTLKRVAYDTLEGVPDATVFNIEQLTPKRMLKLWIRYLNSISYKSDGQRLVFETSERNPELKTIRQGLTVDEDANELITTNILFKPIIFKIETLVEIDFPETMEQNPNRLFKFNWQGNVYKGFITKGGVADDDNRSQVFTLICSADTDESKLIA